ncbi:MAG: Lar family restriction alleviation protein, partial [Oscillospiraceae bacterium]
MNEELKPCPFCGSTEAKLTKCHAEWGYGWHVTCNNCLSVGETAYSDRTGMTAKTPEEKGREMKAHA